MSSYLPKYKWTRNLNELEPTRQVHTFSRPPFLEAMSLLNVASRVGSYIWHERSHHREPIFDLNGLMLEPPNPGPYGGCPLGGMGSGCIGRGYRGDFRRWSIYPGRYIHHTIQTNQFCIRIKTSNKIYSQVLSVFDGRDSSLLSTWNWGVPREKVTYHALFPRAWTEFTEPIPGIDVIITQLSPIFPHSYAECSLPCCVFEVEVINKTSEDMECSVMFVWENSAGQIPSKVDSSELQLETYHDVFSIPVSNELSVSKQSNIIGVCQLHPHITRVHSTNCCYVPGNSVNESNDQQEGNDGLLNHDQSINNTKCCQRDYDFLYCDQGSFAIATQIEDDENDPNQKVSVCERLSVEEHSNTFIHPTALWSSFHHNGNLFHIVNTSINFNTNPNSSLNTETKEENSNNNNRNYRVASAVCHQKLLPAGSNKSYSFSLAWDVPIVRFGGGRAYNRFYSRIFGNSGLSSPSIASYALLRRHYWHDKITEWQSNIQNDESLPSYYRSQLFNELYFLVDGGTQWIDTLYLNINSNSTDHVFSSLPIGHKFTTTIINESLNISVSSFINSLDTQMTTLSMKNIFEVIVENCIKQDNIINSGVGNPNEVGRFLYLEGHEYLMYNTYDVHFYAGFALLMLWPKLELSLQRDIANSVALKDSTIRTMLGEGQKRQRKMVGAVPHDVGSPSEDPLFRTNIYNFQDVSLWKDLGPKFVLQIYRDYKYTNSPWFLVDIYPVILQVMLNVEEFDRNKDGMIENEGFPDQTYDIWTATGVHAYCGGLWIAACFATAEMSKEMNDFESYDKYTTLANKAKIVYENELWNGTYFNYDNSNNSHHDSIMADMLAGQWYTSLCKLPRVVSHEKALSCLQTIFDFNVRRFSPNNLSGAVNGMRPNGTIDSTCLQSREVWTGTTYALAATMIHTYYESTIKNNCKDDSLPSDAIITSNSLVTNQLKIDNELSLLEMAFETAEGIHFAGWQRYGYWFATPEAWEHTGNYRSLGYMRPLAIWAIQYALDQERKKEIIITER